jgi:Fur family zinc uptake transcriptional regulator
MKRGATEAAMPSQDGRFPKRVEVMLDAAHAACAAHGARLTALRRQVLGLVLESAQPIGAYALLDRLKESRTGAAPPTVYRALEFLLEHGFVHKVERLNAFIGCHSATSGHEHHDHDHAHTVQFLICGKCGRVQELEDESVRSALATAALRAGFAPGRMTVEVEGVCRDCASP